MNTPAPRTAVEALTANGKRNLRLLTETLRALAPGTLVDATFRSDTYGTHLVTGAVVRSSATDGLLVGGQALDTSGFTRTPVRELFALTRRKTLAEKHFVPRDDDSLGRAVEALRHGDIIEAVFEGPPYGRFAITGPAIHAPAGEVYVIGDGNYLTRPGRRSAAQRLISLELLADASSHRLPTPERVGRWPDTSPIDR